MEYKILNCPHCGKIISQPKPRHETKRKIVKCPECGTLNNWKDGIRQTCDGNIQRYLCRDCGRRHS